MAHLLWAFDFETNEHADLSWATGYKSGLTNPPESFRPKLRPKNGQRAQEIADEYAKSDAYLKRVLG